MWPLRYFGKFFWAQRYWPQSAGTPPPPSSGDDQNKVRVGVVRGSYVSDNPSIGGQF